MANSQQILGLGHVGCNLVAKFIFLNIGDLILETAGKQCFSYTFNTVFNVSKYLKIGIHGFLRCS